MTQIVATALIANPDGRLFVQRRSPARRLFPGSWDLAGGHVDPGETVEQALGREVLEETGWTVAQVRAELSPKTWHAEDGTRLERQFIVTVSGDLAAPDLEISKVDAWRWIGREDLGILKENRPVEDSLIYDSVLEAFDWIAENN